MTIRCLTPVTTVADKNIRFALNEPDALTWISIVQCGNESTFAHLLSRSPEVLVFCLSRFQVSRKSRLRTCSVESLLSEFLQSSGNSSMDSVDANAAVYSFESDTGKEVVRRLSEFQTASPSPDLADQLVDQMSLMVAETCELGESAVRTWLGSMDIPASVWYQISRLSGDFGGVTVDLDRVLERESETADRLQREKMASMKQLAYGASHEINNPLANIASRAQTLLMDEEDPERRLRLAKINEQAFRAHEMIADMMLFAHPPQPDFVLHDPVEIVSRVVSELQPVAEQQNTRFKLDFRAVESGRLDETQLAVAVKAIITNSLESLRESGTISIGVDSPDNSALEITIADDGPGIEAGVLKHIFDPFFSGREAGRGLGFGLSKAWRIAELHGGEISAESPAHGGARFCLRIPYRDAA